LPVLRTVSVRITPSKCGGVAGLRNGGVDIALANKLSDDMTITDAIDNEFVEILGQSGAFTEIVEMRNWGAWRRGPYTGFKLFKRLRIPKTLEQFKPLKRLKTF
jgi:hypothetical protein